MFCKHCGNQVADDAIFCSNCGARLIEDLSQAPSVENTEIKQHEASAEAPVEAPAARPFLEEMAWNVSEYPDSSVVEKTEDINFDWGLDPEEAARSAAGVTEPVKAEPQVENVKVEAEAGAEAEGGPVKKGAESVADVFDRVVPSEEVKASIPVREALEAANKVESVGQFNTFNKKNAEFQQLLDKEYEKVRRAGTIANEQEVADEAASRKFESRQEEMTMDDFLQKEGVVKRYEPEEVKSDVLDRIKAQDDQRARKLAEEEARIKAIEEARAEEAAKKKAQEEEMNAQIEARAAAEAEIRAAEQAQAQRVREEEARKQAAEEAARLEAIARRKAEEEARVQEEARLRAAEEARARAEEEARLKAEEEARARAAQQAKAQAEEAARIKAETDLKAAQEAVKIRAQQEAAMAAREEAEFKAAQERKLRQEEISRLKKEAEEKQRARAEDSVAVENEVRRVFEQTAKMRQEEEEKIKAALAGIRGGRFSDTLSATEPEVEPAAESAAETKTEEKPATEQRPDTILAEEDKIEEAHRQTRYNIEGMAKAREDFFAELPGGDPEADKTPVSHTDFASPETRTVDKEAIASGLSSTKKLTRDESKVATAIGAGDLLSQFARLEDDRPEEVAPEEVAPEEVAGTTENSIEATEDIVEVPEIMPVEEKGVEEPETEVGEIRLREPEDIPAESTPEYSDEFFELEDVKEETDDPALAALMAEKPGLEDTMVMPEINHIEDLTANDINSYDEPDQDELSALKAAATQQQARELEEAAAAEAEQQDAIDLANRADHVTVQQIASDMAEKVSETQGTAGPQSMTGAQEITEGIAAVEASLAGQSEDAPAAAEEISGETQPSPRELKKLERAKAKEARKLKKQKKKEEKQKIKEDTFGEDEAAAVSEDGNEEETKGGKGRLILMIILILLCVIFALELVGIGIKMFASTSAAAEFIDNILNSLIHMITGESGGTTGNV